MTSIVSHSRTISSPGQARSNNGVEGSAARDSTIIEGPTIVRELDTNNESEDDGEAPAVALPLIEDFSFNSILSHCKPQADNAIDSLMTSLESYREDLTYEVEDIIQTQDELASRMVNLDKLAKTTLSSTQARANRAQSDLNSLKGIDHLATAAERAYDCLSRVIASLHEIDNLLPAQERLAPFNSPHKSHYPRIHQLLQNSPPISANATTSIHTLRHSSGYSLTSVAAHVPPSITPSPPPLPLSADSLANTIRPTAAPATAASTAAIANPGSEPSFRPSPLITNPSTQSLAGYPKPLLNLKSVAPSTSISANYMSNPNGGSPRRLSLPMEQLPMFEAESASTISKSTTKSTFSFREFLGSWSRSGTSNNISENDTAEARLRKIIESKAAAPPLRRFRI